MALAITQTTCEISAPGTGGPLEQHGDALDRVITQKNVETNCNARAKQTT